jgi:DNA-binding LytR/AlgR family response regulator
VRYIYVKNRFKHKLLDEKDVCYIKKDRRKVYVCTYGDSYWQYADMNHFIEGRDRRFHRCHSSLMINLDKIKTIGDGGATLLNGEFVTMCRGALQQTRKAWRGYIARK